jgi:hypothetical protein
VEEDGLMELVTLDSNNQAESNIENYDSLIWTERFNSGIGEFVLVTGDTSLMDQLPEGQMVSLRESDVPMIVETHLIERKKNQPTKLTIKGRAFESILDRRSSIQTVAGGAADWAVTAKIPCDVAYYIIKRICVDGSADVNDIFPTSLVDFQQPPDYLTGTGPNRSFTVPRGNLLNVVMGFLQTEAAAEPAIVGPPAVVATPAVEQHGIRSKKPSQTGTKIAVQLYKGTNRSGTVYFDGTRDLLDDGSYLFSKVGSGNTAYVLGTAGAVTLNQSGVPKSGLERRVILVDGTSSGVTTEAALVEQGKTSLAEAKETVMFDGSINQDLSPYVYGEHYFLGDIVRLVGDYGVEENARVTEYIRSKDATGIKSYPTLVAISNP